LIYNKWNKLKSYGKEWDKEIKTYVRSYDGELIKLNEIEDILYSGIKKVYQLKLKNGKKLKATADHKIMTKRGWVKLKKLKKTDYIMIDTTNIKRGIKQKRKRGKSKYNLFWNLWFHPYAPPTKLKHGKIKYTKRAEKHRIIFEANINNLSIKEFLYNLRNNENSPNIFKFIDPSKFHIHHKDGNSKNNNIKNLQKMTPKKHWKLHAKKSNVYGHFSQGLPTYSKFKSLKFIGKKKTYDICCKDPPNNFVANGMVVHNSGKTVVIAGLVSCFTSENILILIHTTDLVRQTIKELNSFGLHCTEFSGKKKQISRITVATIQSFKNVVKEHADFFDCVVVDECHHISSPKGSYANVLSFLSAPVKLGTTATMPYKIEAQWSLESLIGPLISEYKISAAQKDGILAKPEIIIHKTPSVDSRILDSSVGLNKRKDGTEPTTYVKHYHHGIVHNTSRNFMISEIAKEYMKKNKTVLISVVNVVHGKNISKLIKGCVFVHGATPKEEREEIKKKFIAKKIKCVVATIVWQEGVNLPSLDCCILAGSGKSDIKTIQGIGRGLRKTKTKNKVIIVDFNDHLISKYLKNHFNKRMKTYKKMGWL